MDNYDLRNLIAHTHAGAIITALMHRIPSELCSEACLGESSTRMGDLLGSPRVAPLFFTGVSINGLEILKMAFWGGTDRRAIIPALMNRIPSELRNSFLGTGLMPLENDKDINEMVVVVLQSKNVNDFCKGHGRQLFQNVMNKEIMGKHVKVHECYERMFEDENPMESPQVQSTTVAPISSPLESPQVQPRISDPTSIPFEPPKPNQDQQVQPQVKPRKQSSRFKPPRIKSKD
ncbi:hypothetical protein Lal_00008486, partial [Lupinus albus]